MSHHLAPYTETVTRYYSSPLGPHLEFPEAHGVIDGLTSNAPENCVLAVQVVAAIKREEKLGAVGMRRVGVGARHQTPAHPLALIRLWPSLLKQPLYCQRNILNNIISPA